GLLVPYLTAYFALTAAGFKADQVVLAPAVGGAVGNATVQLARAMGAGRVLSTASTTAKTEQARAAGYENVIDLSRETLTTGVKRLTGGAGANVAIDSVGGPVTSQVLASLARGGALIVLGYPAVTRTTIEVTDLIWKRAHMQGFSLFAYTPEQLAAAYDTTLRPLLSEGRIRPAVARTFPLEAASEAQRYLNESRPFGRVVLTL
ncbi:MAG TPA: zinc-binding dehydrogenase, partial [Ktedonobacteraceae bacterium]|nr:zinc-binding dehydrogenase [Ktedonobacteraceae bacterium]